jgi:GntP family gluconate:H+ symporter
VIIQIIMVGLIIAFPGIVSRDKEEKIDLDKVKIEMPVELPGSDAQPQGLPQPGADGAATPSSEDEEQKKIDELFNKK